MNPLRIFIGCWLVTICLPALAYVDPVSGAMLLQIIISGVAGFAMVFRKAVTGLFRRLLRKITGKSDRTN